MEAYIEASHKRCIGKGILPEGLFSTKIIEGEELKKKLEQNKELILTATPFINHIYNFVKGSDFFAILCDGDGCILNVIGDEKILSEALKLKMVAGAYMDENHIGTNGMSLALSEKMPIQIYGKDHFIKAYYKWTCSAAPIKNKDGKVIGIIDLTGYTENVYCHTLGMVVAAANAIEKMLEINNYNLMLEISKKRLETTFDSIDSGILAVDVFGNIISMNKQIVKMLGYNQKEMSKIKVSNIIQSWGEILDRLGRKESFVDEDIYVNSRVNKLQFTVTAYPIFNSNDKLEEITLMFYELKKSRKLAGKILSGQAIYTFDKMIAKDEKIINLIEYAKKIADSKSTVLITGESGTGKEIFAQAIHNYSNRKDEPFIAVNCGAIPRTLIESELFGYEDGAFTGARKGGNAGKFEIAEGGTIFLDEIGEMPADMQTKLLRVVEESVIMRIGSAKQIPINVRIIAATNKNLKYEVGMGNFRKDLFYRLNVLPLLIPPLRERKDDIYELINYYMDRISKRLNKRKVNITKEYMEYLLKYDWPGNIRELENVIEQIINSEIIQMNLLNETANPQKSPPNLAFNQSLEEMEKHHIINVIKQSEGNMTLAAKTLGIGRNTLYRKIQNYGIESQQV